MRTGTTLKTVITVRPPYGVGSGGVRMSNRHFLPTGTITVTAGIYPEGMVTGDVTLKDLCVTIFTDHGGGR